MASLASTANMWLAFNGVMFLRWLQLQAFAKAWGVHIPPRTTTVIFQYTQKPKPSGLAISVCRGLLVAGLCWGRGLGLV